jgi:hypothetical protein
MLTIFTIPKPFTGGIGTIQLNALRSWTLLEPSCQVILCGDEIGVEDAAAKFGVGHISGIHLNDYGTPLLNSAFERVVEIARFPLICYVNADIILFNDLIEAIRRIRFPEYLMIGERHNLDLDESLDFEDPDWSPRLRNLARSAGSLATHFFLDYFVFTPNGLLEILPPFAVGRPRWDNWFVYHARELGVPVIDASRRVLAIHQNHDYSHIPHKELQSCGGSEAQWEGPEARKNRELSRGSMRLSHQFTMLDATHIMTQKFILPAYPIRYLKKRWHSLPALHPETKQVILTVGQITEAVKRIGGRLSDGLECRFHK